MVLELHIWGPAFSLPSIDPQCLATIAYLVQAVPEDAWVLVASSDPSVSPTNELPALKDGATWVSKFRNIVDYLRQYSNGEWDLDSRLEGLERADSIAFSAFTESNGQLLVDLSLYVASQNYFAGTSAAYGAMLTWPNQWIIPPRIRSAAKRRTEHLGLSSLDLAASQEQRERERSAAVAAGQIPKNLIQRPRETVSSLLGKTSQKRPFKLAALTAELFEPLQQLLGDKKYLLSDTHPTTLDALVLGYLVLAYVPDLPAPWLRESLKSKTPRLASYIERMRPKYFGEVQLADAFSGGTTNTSNLLPWRRPQDVTATKIGNTLLNTLADATPVLKDLRMRDRLRETARSPESGPSSKAVSEAVWTQKKDLYISIASVAAGMTALVGYLFHVGVLAPSSGDLPEEEDYKPVEIGSGFGSAGDFLSAL